MGNKADRATRPDPPRSSRDADFDGLTIVSHGRRVLVEDTAGEVRSCIVPRRLGRIVCGDRVAWSATDNGRAGVIEGCAPRATRLERPDRRGRSELLAANVSQLVVVVAPAPPADLGLTDRYLAAGRLMGVHALLVRNKTDLADAPLDAALGEYTQIEYPVFPISARDASGLQPLRAALRAQLSVLVGQSGAGKSSLLNALVPDADVRTAQLSAATGEGRHTTSTSVLHHLPEGGSVIDSPGVRDYSPPPIAELEVTRGYVEIDALNGQCRFADCRHLLEPDCAVKAAVGERRISERRYRSYCALLERMRTLKPDDYG